MQIWTEEKMIVNQLQCFIGSGIKVLSDYLMQQLIDTYIKIETKLNFKNKGLLFLLSLLHNDPEALVR
jgi:hypothetical protein